MALSLIVFVFFQKTGNQFLGNYYWMLMPTFTRVPGNLISSCGYWGQSHRFVYQHTDTQIHIDVLTAEQILKETKRYIVYMKTCIFALCFVF